MISEISIKISFAEGGGTSVLASSGGVDIAPPTLGGDAAADLIPALPDVGAETAAAAGIDVPPPPADAAAEVEHLAPPGAEDEPGDSSHEDAPPPSPGRGAKRGR